MNPDLPTIDSLAYCESDALDHAAIEAGKIQYPVVSEAKYVPHSSETTTVAIPLQQGEVSRNSVSGFESDCEIGPMCNEIVNAIEKQDEQDKKYIKDILPLPLSRDNSYHGLPSFNAFNDYLHLIKGSYKAVDSFQQLEDVSTKPSPTPPEIIGWLRPWIFIIQAVCSPSTKTDMTLVTSEVPSGRAQESTCLHLMHIMFSCKSVGDDEDKFNDIVDKLLEMNANLKLLNIGIDNQHTHDSKKDGIENVVLSEKTSDTTDSSKQMRTPLADNGNTGGIVYEHSEQPEGLNYYHLRGMNSIPPYSSHTICFPPNAGTSMYAPLHPAYGMQTPVAYPYSYPQHFPNDPNRYVPDYGDSCGTLQTTHRENVFWFGKQDQQLCPSNSTTSADSSSESDCIIGNQFNVSTNTKNNLTVSSTELPIVETHEFQDSSHISEAAINLPKHLDTKLKSKEYSSTNVNFSPEQLLPKPENDDLSMVPSELSLFQVATNIKDLTVTEIIPKCYESKELLHSDHCTYEYCLDTPIFIADDSSVVENIIEESLDGVALTLLFKNNDEAIVSFGDNVVIDDKDDNSAINKNIIEDEKSIACAVDNNSTIENFVTKENSDSTAIVQQIVEEEAAAAIPIGIENNASGQISSDNTITQLLSENKDDVACSSKDILTEETLDDGAIAKLISEEEEEIASGVSKDIVEEYFELLLNYIPEADPEYLQAKCESFVDDPTQLEAFVHECLETGNSFPSIDDYLKRQEVLSIEKEHLDKITVSSLIEIFPRPFDYFYVNKNKEKEEENHELGYLQRKFRTIADEHLKAVLEHNNHNLSSSIKELELWSGVFRPKRGDWECDIWPVVNMPFLYEVFFIENEAKIREHLEMESYNRSVLQRARLMESRLECGICCNNELEIEEMAACIEGHLFCKDCVTKNSELRFGEGHSTFPCLESCGVEFSMKTLQGLLNPTMFSRILKLRMLEDVKSADIENLEMCPFCEYVAIVPPEMMIFICGNPECLEESCSFGGNWLMSRQSVVSGQRCVQTHVLQVVWVWVGKMSQSVPATLVAVGQKDVPATLCKEKSHTPLRCDEVEKEKETQMRTEIEDRMTEALVRCPLFTNDDVIHREDVKKAGEEAKADVTARNPSFHLKIDPTQSNRAKEICDVITNRAKERFSFTTPYSAVSLPEAEKYQEYEKKFPARLVEQTTYSYSILQKDQLKTEIEVVHRGYFTAPVPCPAGYPNASGSNSLRIGASPPGELGCLRSISSFHYWRHTGTFLSWARDDLEFLVPFHCASRHKFCTRTLKETLKSVTSLESRRSTLVSRFGPLQEVSCELSVSTKEVMGLLYK
uniref:RING-type domain-containing protein n=1 Tax=Timema monikensis TaxID=170555 RepID=A0A7R9DWM8_9NEOP|nr:unnamed protein product [Timema monikensis]